MLNTKEFFLWLEGFMDKVEGDMPSASEWVELKRKMLKVDYEQKSCTTILTNYILNELPNSQEDDEEDESMTVMYGVFPEGDSEIEDEIEIVGKTEAITT